MILSGHQPCYLPGIQLINKIMLSDVFMHVGHCQYQSGEWHSHNFIDTCELIVPVHKGQSIDETTIVYDDPKWRKLRKSLRLAYGNCEYVGELGRLHTMKWSSLGEFNRAILYLFLDWLKIKTRMLDSQKYPAVIAITKDPVGMLIEMCRAAGADEYLSNEGARKPKGYIGPEEEQRMADAGITHRWQSFTHPIYGQNGKSNLGRLSIIDPLIRLGPERTRELCLNSGRIA